MRPAPLSKMAVLPPIRWQPCPTWLGTEAKSASQNTDPASRPPGSPEAGQLGTHRNAKLMPKCQIICQNLVLLPPKSPGHAPSSQSYSILPVLPVLPALSAAVRSTRVDPQDPQAEPGDHRGDVGEATTGVLSLKFGAGKAERLPGRVDSQWFALTSRSNPRWNAR